MTGPDCSQYAAGTTRNPDAMPPEITDPDGDTRRWTDADQRGIPGYQFAGGITMSLSPVGIGPAHTVEYIEGGQYKVVSR